MPTLLMTPSQVTNIIGDTSSSTLVKATGSADQTVINAAFATSLSVSLRDETYTLTGAIVIPSGGSLIMVPGTILSRTGTGDAIQIVGTSPAHFAGCRVTGGKIVGTSLVGTQVAGNGIYVDFCDGAYIAGVEVTAFGANGDDGAITIRRSTDIEVTRCNLHHSKNGLCTGQATSNQFPEASFCTFHHNKAHDNYDDGIHLQQSGRNRINDNSCYSNGADAASVGSGIDLLGDESDVVANNFCYSNVGMGIEVGNTTTTGSADQRHTIIGNVCNSNGTRGIGFLAWSERCTVTGNTCNANGEDGIQFGGSATHESSYHTCTGNICNANTRHGIYLVNTTNFVHVANNITRSNSARGIYVVSAGAGNPTSNEILGNQAIGNTTSQITLGSGATSTIIRNNTGYVSQAGGVVSVADGGTITHGLAAAPTKYSVTATTSGEFASVTATSSTTMTLAIKKHDNTAGTTQNIAWFAEV